ncbi:MAG: NnrS family protein, partial [Candidatus Competibacteraceae bacterium]|nr:NnrS family protein [Candidatus Competibacteraceae bacterium]
MSTLFHPYQTPPLLSLGLRPFFLAAGLFAGGAILLWLATLHGIQGGGLYWHVHEMLYGFVGAAIGGFLLTAVPNWTGRPALRGLPLLGLVAIWALARLPLGTLAAVLDVGYWLLLAGWVARQLLASGNRNNLPMVGILTLLGVLNALYYTGLAGITPLAPLTALYLTLHLILVLVAVIGGRIIPAFTRNWMQANGRSPLPMTRPRVEIAALALVPLTGLADGLAPGSTLAGALALGAALAHGVRLAGWRGLRTLPEWLLTVLHMGYGWLVVGYLLLGLAAFGWVPRSA